MREFLLNLFLPRFSKLDFVNLFAFFLLSLFFSNRVEAINFSTGTSIFGILILAIFLLGLYLFIFREEQYKALVTFVKPFLYTVLVLVLLLSVYTQLNLGFFSFSAASWWETILSIFSVWVLLRALALYFLVRGPKFFGISVKEFEKRVESRPFSRRSLLVGVVLTVILFAVLVGFALVPNPIIGVPFVFLVDGFAEQIEKLIWIKN